MTPEQRFSLIIAAIGIVLTVLIAVLRALVRIATQTGKTLNEVQTTARQLDEHLRWHRDNPTGYHHGGGRRR